MLAAPNEVRLIGRIHLLPRAAKLELNGTHRFAKLIGDLFVGCAARREPDGIELRRRWLSAGVGVLELSTHSKDWAEKGLAESSHRRTVLGRPTAPMNHVVRTHDRIGLAVTGAKALRQHRFRAGPKKRIFKGTKAIADGDVVVRNGYPTTPNALKDIVSVGETGAEQRRPVTASKHLGNGRKVLCARLPEGDIDASYAEPLGDVTEADVEYPAPDDRAQAACARRRRASDLVRRAREDRESGHAAVWALDRYWTPSRSTALHRAPARSMTDPTTPSTSASAAATPPQKPAASGASIGVDGIEDDARRPTWVPRNLPQHSEGSCLLDHTVGRPNLKTVRS